MEASSRRGGSRSDVRPTPERPKAPRIEKTHGVTPSRSVRAEPRGERPLLRITYRGVRGLRLEGEVDISNVRELDGALEQGAGNGGDLFVDVRGLNFIDGRGVVTLYRHALRMGEDGRVLWLVSPPRIMTKLIRIFGFDQLDSLRIATNDAPEGHARGEFHGSEIDIRHEQGG